MAGSGIDGGDLGGGWGQREVLRMGTFEAETPDDISWVQRGSVEKRSGVGSRRCQGGRGDLSRGLTEQGVYEERTPPWPPRRVLAAPGHSPST